ncbi:MULTISPECIES: hypothetical protein [Pseudoalteromonas]|uniref:Uncharacterized protein n=1 Tax=Pseudoalteromonas luteoviolacea (strain 2ta16) TaxID=1353533 RepID=V4I336_PSEL2|nr:MULTISPECIES: hypothetical protein [Pseudoalteromonas]ESP94649.1 hypothetical protein PL2TA16_00649 [Pseudoalteromonas luteoviolacea 2ta16]KZN32348.1 hypothetical protein N483_04130 [Pseudoalteromonas luteoviolacea NCIMB 1944]MCG7547516.1 hypothetical protein [Pseudoalteromonas sp. Of7M-16]
MGQQQVYGANAFCKDAISNWSVVEPELLEWQDEVHNCLAILADGLRNQTISATEVFCFLESVLSLTDVCPEIENAIAISFIEYSELETLGLSTKVTPSVKDVLKKQYECWQKIHNGAYIWST